MKKINVIKGALLTKGVQNLFESVDEIVKLYPHISDAHLVALRFVESYYGKDLEGYIFCRFHTEKDPIFVQVHRLTDTYELLND